MTHETELPHGRCCCHEPTVRWCTRHGEPLKLKPSERILVEGEIRALADCLDESKAQKIAYLTRAMARS